MACNISRNLPKGTTMLKHKLFVNQTGNGDPPPRRREVPTEKDPVDDTPPAQPAEPK